MQKKFFKKEIQICGDCKGEGVIWEQTEPARHGSDYGTGHEVTCTTCAGEGRVKVTRNIIIDIEPHKRNSNE